MKQPPDEKLLRKREVLRILGISNSTYYNRIKDGTIKPGALLGPRCKAHPSSEIQACIADLIAKRDAA